MEIAFIHAFPEENVYMAQIQGFAHSSYVWKLQESFYALKQTPRAWYSQFNSRSLELGL